MVLGIGVYLRRYANTSNDFFMAAREMTAWVAGLSFLSANLGAIELIGWAASTYQYGILAAHFYWIAAFPSMVFLGLVMMPFYCLSKTHSVPGYLQLRYGEGARALSGISFAFTTVLMSGINMYAMALVMKVVLGWNIHTSASGSRRSPSPSMFRSVTSTSASSTRFCSSFLSGWARSSSPSSA